MTLTPTILNQAILSNSTFKGLSWGILAPAIATGVATWVNTPSSIKFQGTATGFVGGVGEVKGVATFPPSPTFVATAVSASGLNGPLALELYKAVGLACASSMGGISYKGGSPGILTGSDVSKVSAVDVPALEASLRSAVESAFISSGGIPQRNQSLLSKGISVALGQQTLLGFGAGAVTPASPSAVSSLIGSAPTFSIIGKG